MFTGAAAGNGTGTQRPDANGVFGDVFEEVCMFKYHPFLHSDVDF